MQIISNFIQGYIQINKKKKQQFKQTCKVHIDKCRPMRRCADKKTPFKQMCKVQVFCQPITFLYTTCCFRLQKSNLQSISNRWWKVLRMSLNNSIAQGNANRSRRKERRLTVFNKKNTKVICSLKSVTAPWQLVEVSIKQSCIYYYTV